MIDLVTFSYKCDNKQALDVSRDARLISPTARIIANIIRNRLLSGAHTFPVCLHLTTGVHHARANIPRGAYGKLRARLHLLQGSRDRQMSHGQTKLGSHVDPSPSVPLLETTHLHVSVLRPAGLRM